MRHRLAVTGTIAMGIGIGAGGAGCGDDGFEFDPDPPGNELYCSYSKRSPSGLGPDERASIVLSELVSPIERRITRGGEAVSYTQYVDSTEQGVAREDRDGPEGRPDGAMDLEHTIDWSDDAKLVFETRALSDGRLLAKATHLLDDRRRLLRRESEQGVIEYTRGPDGRTDAIDENRIDPDTGAAYTRRTELTYGPDERLLAKRVTDSRLAAPQESSYAHEDVPAGVIVRRTSGGVTASYSYEIQDYGDGQRKTTSAQADEDGDGIWEWTSTLTTRDRADVITERRDGEVTWEYKITHDCRHGIVGPYLVTGIWEPSADWRLFAVPYPDPYQARPTPP